MHHVFYVLDCYHFAAGAMFGLNDLAIAALADDFKCLVVAVNILPRVGF